MQNILRWLVKNHIAMAHILSLENNQSAYINNEGWNDDNALDSSKSRYRKLSGEELKLYKLDNFATDKLMRWLNNPKSHNFMGFIGGWKGHTISISIVKAGAITHFIYVNKSNEDVSKVMVYSIETTAALEFAKKMQEKFLMRTKDAFDNFLFDSGYSRNLALESIFELSELKVRNCTTGNSNITWHFQMASEYMQKNNCDFAAAYKQTQERYKKLRMLDRIAAFKYLLHEHYLKKNAFYYNLFNAAIKITRKDSKNKPYLELLGNNFKDFNNNAKNTADLDPHILTDAFLDDFENKSNNYFNAKIKYFEKYIFDPNDEQIFERLSYLKNNLDIARDKLLKVAFPKLPKPEQIAKIYADVTFLKYAKKEMQIEILEQNPLYYAYCSYQIIDSKYINAFFDIFGADLRNRKELKIENYAAANLPITRNKIAAINNCINIFNGVIKYFNDDCINQIFDELCRTCCQHTNFLGKKYSLETPAGKWLIKIINNHKELKAFLRLDNENELRQRIVQSFTNPKIISLKYQEIVQTVDTNMTKIKP